MAAETVVRVPVQPTEDPERVAEAVRRLFPGAALRRTDAGLEGPGGPLDRLRDLVREQRIPDTARGRLLRGQEGGTTRFAVNKQAAAAGRLNFVTREGPLGDIQVEVRAADAEELGRLIDEVAPDTRGWSPEARGLTEAGLRQKEAENSELEEMEREPGPGEDRDRA